MKFKETETIELKKSTAELKNEVVSISAILNKRGKGELYFGIKDDGTVVGQTIGRDTVKHVTQTIVDNIEPKIFPEISVEDIQGKECVVVRFEGSDIPYFAYGRAYMRVGESDKQMTAKQIEDCIRKNKISWEKEISEKSLKDVNANVVKKYMRDAKKAKRVDFDFVNVGTTLHKLHLLRGNNLTQAAEVLFCDDNTMEIQAAIFAGTDKHTFLDIKSFKGNLFSLREQAQIYVFEHIKWRAEIKAGPRKEIPEIPVEAVREAIGNSLCHRDYSNPKGNEVAIFKDRVEIYNPGFFPDEVDPEDFFTGHEHSILRNPLIAETMYKSKDIERWGSGIKRIHDECGEANVKVEFKRLKTGFVVVFYRPKWEDGEGLEEKTAKKGEQVAVENAEEVRKKCGRSAEKVLNAIKADSFIKTHEIADQIQLSQRTVENAIAKLKEEGFLKRIGSRKSGHWEVLE